MSCNYAHGLSDYFDKGICGIPEVYDEEVEITKHVAKLAEFILSSKRIVFHTGAGISTAAGIPDFRGPKGVWTLEKKGEKPCIDVSFDRAVPTFTHLFLRELAKSRPHVTVVSQNIDGLHLRSGLVCPNLYELHGNMFLDQCDNCGRLFIRNTPSPTVGQKYTGARCPWGETTGRRPCKGNLRDTILDWDAELPPDDLTRATQLSKQADLSIALGTTLQIVPSGNLPVLTKEQGGKLVICNLQPTKHDEKADLVIHGYVDNILLKLAKILGLDIPAYEETGDPTKSEQPLTFYRTPSIKPRVSLPDFEDDPTFCEPQVCKKRRYSRRGRPKKEDQPSSPLENGTRDRSPILVKVKKEEDGDTKKSDKPTLEVNGSIDKCEQPSGQDSELHKKESDAASYHGGSPTSCLEEKPQIAADVDAGTNVETLAEITSH